MAKILTLSSAKHFGLTSGDIRIGSFSGGEVSLSIKEDVKGQDVFIVGSINAPAENLIELLFTIDTVNRLGAENVTVVIPYFGYSRAIKEKYPGESVSAETTAKLIDAVGGGNLKVISLDVHSNEISRFFKSFENISTLDIFAERSTSFGDFTVVAPDKGAAERAKELAKKINCEKVAVVQKERAEDGSVTVKGIEGNVTDRVLMIDDIIDSGGTILKGAEFLKSRGASEIHIAVTHMVWQGGGYKILADSGLVTKIYTTDTINPPAFVPEKIEILSVAPLLQKIING